MKFSIDDLRQQLVEHPLYSSIKTDEDLRLFMRAHVFCVWDFQSLLKDLQRRFTCTSVPWLPTEDGRAARLINEIVMEEESDEHPTREYASHYILYQDAMEQSGADTTPIKTLHKALLSGDSLEQALQMDLIPSGVADFVRTTFKAIHATDDHASVAVFTHGREDLLPDIFVELVKNLSANAPEQWSMFLHYLNRHIEVDGERHGPISHALLERVCGEDEKKWREAELAAREALQARLDLWDAILTEINHAKAA